MSIIFLFIQIVISIFIIRFHVSQYSLGFNPVLEKLNQFSDPLVSPLRKLLSKIPLFDPARRMQYQNNPFLRKMLNYDIPALIVGLLIALLIGLLVGRSFGLGILVFLKTWLNVIFYAIFIVVIGSWLQTHDNQPVMQIAKSCSDWLLRPLQSVIPQLGMFDISPVVALLILSLFEKMLLP